MILKEMIRSYISNFKTNMAEESGLESRLRKNDETRNYF